MPERIAWILQRRSIREFQNRDVEKEKIKLLLQAAMAAPSARNRQPWYFVVVTNEEKRTQLADLHPSGKIIRRAPLTIAVCGDVEASRNTKTGLCYWTQDCSAAMENLLLAAPALDLGAVWLGVHPTEDREEAVMEVLKLPEGIKPLGLACVGYPGEKKEPNTYYREDKVHYEEFRS